MAVAGGVDIETNRSVEVVDPEQLVCRNRDGAGVRGQ